MGGCFSSSSSAVQPLAPAVTSPPYAAHQKAARTAANTDRPSTRGDGPQHVSPFATYGGQVLLASPSSNNGWKHSHSGLNAAFSSNSTSAWLSNPLKSLASLFNRAQSLPSPATFEFSDLPPAVVQLVLQHLDGAGKLVAAQTCSSLWRHVLCTASGVQLVPQAEQPGKGLQPAQARVIGCLLDQSCVCRVLHLRLVRPSDWLLLQYLTPLLDGRITQLQLQGALPSRGDTPDTHTPALHVSTQLLLAQAITRLTHLTLHSLFVHSAAQLQDLVPAPTPTLTHLVLDQVFLPSTVGPGLTALLQHMPNLQQFRVCNVASEPFAAQPAVLGRMTHLELPPADASGATRKWMALLTAQPATFTALKHLATGRESLALDTLAALLQASPGLADVAAYTVFVDEDQEVSGAGVVTLFSKLQLASLELTGQACVDDLCHTLEAVQVAVLRLQCLALGWPVATASVETAAAATAHPPAARVDRLLSLIASQQTSVHPATATGCLQLCDLPHKPHEVAALGPVLAPLVRHTISLVLSQVTVSPALVTALSSMASHLQHLTLGPCTNFWSTDCDKQASGLWAALMLALPQLDVLGLWEEPRLLTAAAPAGTPDDNAGNGDSVNPAQGVVVRAMGEQQCAAVVGALAVACRQLQRSLRLSLCAWRRVPEEVRVNSGKWLLVRKKKEAPVPDLES